MVLGAFDLGITHFDLANNYGPPPGSAEENFGRILKNDLGQYRDEMIISTKAGYYMWPGPYGEWGSRKYLLASLDQSLKRMGLDYVDIFYHHRPDPETPLEETMGALAHAVRSGKALYVGLSNYSRRAGRGGRRSPHGIGHPLLIHQPRYNIFDRRPEEGLYADAGKGRRRRHPLLPLAQGLLTDRYLNGIPADSAPPAPASSSNRRRSRRNARKGAQAQRHRASPRADPGPDGAGLAAGKTRDRLRPHRRQLGQIKDAVQAQNNLHFSDEELKSIDLISQS